MGAGCSRISDGSISRAVVESLSKTRLSYDECRRGDGRKPKADENNTSDEAGDVPTSSASDHQRSPAAFRNKSWMRRPSSPDSIEASCKLNYKRTSAVQLRDNSDDRLVAAARSRLTPDTPGVATEPLISPPPLDCLGRILCDTDFNIVDTDDSALRLLKYSASELWGKPVACLMTPLIAKLHDKLFDYVKRATPEQICRSARRLIYEKSNCRDMVLLDSNREPVVCGVSIEIQPDRSAIVNLLDVSTKPLHTVPRGYEQYIHRPPGKHVQDYPDVICIMIDIAGSTQYAVRVKPQDMATLMHDVYMAANNIILREVFPYAYIHEICGDSLLLVVNAGFMVRYPGEAAVIAMQAAMQVQRHLNKMLVRYDESMYARVGVTIGDVTAGVIDGRSFRIFGDTVHLSQRLESCCPKDGIACTARFLDLLEKQQAVVDDMSAFGIEYHTKELKGFGATQYGVVNTQKCHSLFAELGYLSDAQ
eukprot:CAMPEP_0177770652 /NCGR_PEP_ID=MMETSP0491_2-20121128/11068_1 /TAXON_ID=63592 /ORGANISM="Tetraselmis chuii, Strain PLY429" /LENGTH=477 /DNA_ID=CAMNT_0019287939 /DNA_START=334 /DNA_END=1767 /DNA_ORIENTATION=+